MQIEVHDIYLSYNFNRPDAFEAIKGVTLNIEKGDFVVFDHNVEELVYEESFPYTPSSIHNDHFGFS